MGTSCWKQQLRYDPFGVRIPAIGSHSWDEAKLLELNCTEHKSLIYWLKQGRSIFIGLFGSDAIRRQCWTLNIDICE